ncbi:hypothetical protein OOU_Y34scaffold01015g11 [Pyricularia oryzae Y34]|uniref:Uncharacterized protein n=2 Tax=Pyricularia oryzae TaxID=318829 RepID=A0AA97NMH8_PYRO3|nr:hypothetical protein OOU_Y34scaffold01015g11 [Pyricularia oryzae Y34]
MGFDDCATGSGKAHPSLSLGNGGSVDVHHALSLGNSSSGLWTRKEIHEGNPVGEISEGSSRAGTGKGLLYRHTEMLVAWKDGQPELRYSLKREFAKGMHNKEDQRPTHILYEHVPGQPLILNPIVFLLAIFLARGAFKSYSTIQQILAVKPPPDQEYWVLDWADRVMNLPVFPTMTAAGLTEKIQTAGAFTNQIRGLSIRAGMERPVTPHGIRRECLIQATR